MLFQDTYALSVMLSFTVRRQKINTVVENLKHLAHFAKRASTANRLKENIFVFSILTRQLMSRSGLRREKLQSVDTVLTATVQALASVGLIIQSPSWCLHTEGSGSCLLSREHRVTSMFLVRSRSKVSGMCKVARVGRVTTETRDTRSRGRDRSIMQTSYYTVGTWRDATKARHASSNI